MDALINRIAALLLPLARWLALAVAALLAAQPLLRTLGSAPQRANDAAQAVFALYVALAVWAAWRRGTHLRAPWLAAKLAARLGPGYARGVRRGVALGVLLPWSLLLLVQALPMLWAAVSQWERFPETGNAGYWLIRLALALLLLLLGLQALQDARRDPA